MPEYTRCVTRHDSLSQRLLAYKVPSTRVITKETLLDVTHGISCLNP